MSSRGTSNRNKSSVVQKQLVGKHDKSSNRLNIIVRLSHMAAVLASANMKYVGAFIPSSGQSIHKHYSGLRNPFSFQLATSVNPPILPYSPNSDENAKKEGMYSPYDDLFRSYLQHEQHGIAKKNKGTHFQNKHVHIILFNQGLREEGVHCIEFPKNSGSNVILAFESSKDCHHFAKHFDSQIDSLPMPQTQKISTHNLNRYASALGIAVQVIPAGINLKPPDRVYSGSVNGSGFGDQVPFLMKLKEQKTYLDRLIGTSSSSSSGSAGDFGSLPAWG